MDGVLPGINKFKKIQIELHYLEHTQFSYQLVNF